MSYSAPRSKRSSSRTSSWCKALLFVILAAKSAPEWLFTIEGCIYLSPDHVQQFSESISKDLGGCTPEDKALARVFKCRDGGAYMIFWKRNDCESAVADFRTRHHLSKRPGTI